MACIGIDILVIAKVEKLAKFTAKDDQPGHTSDHSSKKSRVEPFGHAPSDLV